MKKVILSLLLVAGMSFSFMTTSQAGSNVENPTEYFTLEDDKITGVLRDGCDAIVYTIHEDQTVTFVVYEGVLC